MTRASDLYTFSPFILYARRPYMDFALKYLKECEAGDLGSSGRTRFSRIGAT